MSEAMQTHITIPEAVGLEMLSQMKRYINPRASVGVIWDEHCLTLTLTQDMGDRSVYIIFCEDYATVSLAESYKIDDSFGRVDYATSNCIEVIFETIDRLLEIAQWNE